MTDKQGLADYVRNVMQEKGLSTYDVQKAAGNRITAATVSKIINNDIKSSSVETLTGLAIGLGVKVEELFNIVRGLPPEPSRFELYADAFDAHDLAESEWQFLENYFREHVSRYRAFKGEAGEQGRKKPK